VNNPYTAPKSDEALGEKRSHTRASTALRALAAVLLGNVACYLTYGVLGFIIRTILEQRPNADLAAMGEAILILLTCVATLAGVAAARRVSRRPWWFAPLGVGLGAARPFAIIYLNQGARASFFALLPLFSLLTPLVAALILERAARRTVDPFVPSRADVGQ
jgi:drug/metabolite transporter (DMT)-like permease